VNAMFWNAIFALLMSLASKLPDPRPRQTFVRTAIGLICGDRPKTITSALSFWGEEQSDWSATYRLFSQTQWLPDDMFDVIALNALSFCGGSGPIYAGQDDTLARKTGRRIPGVAYARDPLSPPFQTNLVLGQRFLQTSIMIKPGQEPGPFRAIPAGFLHAPPVKAGRRATEEERAAVKEARKKQNVSSAALRELVRLRRVLDGDANSRQRWLLAAVDNSFANKTYLRGLPRMTAAVARIRKNAKLRAPLPPELRKGNRKYGADLPTPEQYLHDETIPWLIYSVFVAGQVRELKYKVIDPVCWPGVTLDKQLRLIVIKPAGYRLRAGSKLLYREPAYLICTELSISVEDYIQAYVARWEVEVSFRDEKTGLGLGQAQVWCEESVQRAPSLLVIGYACMLLASAAAFGDKRTDAFDPLPLWRNREQNRPSVRDLTRLLRKEALENRRDLAA